MIKHIVSRTYKPMLVKYLSKTRKFRHKDIVLQIPPQVFHPGFFYSTRLLLRYLLALPLEGKSFLELGAGSGLIAFSAVKKGALVTATDINPVAVEYLRQNSEFNNLTLNTIESDLFDDVPKQIFEVVAINPPYYKRNPASFKEQAWYCGENGEYFEKLFQQIGAYTLPSSVIVMILCDGCDIKMIENIAQKNNFQITLSQTSQNLLETNFIYTILKNPVLQQQ